MSLRRTLAIVLRQIYLIRGSFPRLFPLFAWVVVDMVLWVFELEADCTIPAEYIMLMNYLAEIDEVLQSKIAVYLRSRPSTYIQLCSKRGNYGSHHP